MPGHEPAEPNDVDATDVDTDDVDTDDVDTDDVDTDGGDGSAPQRAGEIDPDFDPDAEFMEAYEEQLAERRASAIAAGRRKGGVAGAAMAGAMFAVAEIYEGPKKDGAPVTVEASSDPHDLDKDGFGATFGEVDVVAPALDRIDPVVSRRRKR